MSASWRIIAVMVLMFRDYQMSSPAVIKTGVLLNVNTVLPFDYNFLEVGLRTAFQQAQKVYGVAFIPSVYTYSAYCYDVPALGQAVAALEDGVDLFVGPGCFDDLIVVSKLCTSQNISVVTGGGSYIDSLSAYPYTTRLAYSVKDIWLSIDLMSGRYNWTNFVVIYDRDPRKVWDPSAQGLIRTLKRKNFRVVDYSFLRTGDIEAETATKFLKQATLQARVVVLVTEPIKLRTFMVQAVRLGMCNGDYAFFTADILRKDVISAKAWMRNDTLDDLALQGFRCLFVITLRDITSEPKYQNFMAEVRRLTDGRPTPLDVEWTFHDAIMVYAQIINETAQEGLAITKSNVNLINQKLVNRTFEGATGTIHLGPDGDRMADYQITQLVGDRYIPVAELRGEKGIYQEITPIIWLSPSNTPPVNRPPCGFDGYDQECVLAAQRTLGAGLGGAIAALLLLVAAGFFMYKRHKTNLELRSQDWIVPWKEIAVQQNKQAKSVASAISDTGTLKDTGSPRSQFRMFQPALNFSKSRTEGINKSMAVTKESAPLQGTATVVNYRNAFAVMRPCDHAPITLNDKLRAEVRTVKQMNHENLAKFIGACIEAGHAAVLVEYCSRGSLQDVYQGDNLTLDWVFRLSFITDIAQGLAFLHHSAVEVHGRLTSRCCFIDKRFLLKISDYGLPAFYDAGKSHEPAELLWTAPEILKNHVTVTKPSAESDVYSFGIILQEVILRESPYFQSNMIPEDIIWHVMANETPPFRPKVEDPFCHPEVITMMRSCWSELPSDRPRLSQIRNSLRALSKTFGIEKNSIIDTLLERMEQHTRNLEASVEEKTLELLDEKKKTDHLLYSILPRAVAEQLKRGEHVLPESYENVTIYFGDLVNFTQLSSVSGALDMVNFMNDLYSQFDEIIAAYDAYKVETIGDCYLIVSGLPNRNGLLHAVEIARIAFALRETIKVFVVRHLPHVQLQIRIGMNSGPCVAGVVGFATPRYCLFGDTVNVASRMETTGEAMRIQITESTKAILQLFQSFLIDLRGTIPVKGKGEMPTFWLVAENRALYNASAAVLQGPGSLLGQVDT